MNIIKIKFGEPNTICYTRLRKTAESLPGILRERIAHFRANKNYKFSECTIDSEGFKGGTRGAPIMPRDAVSRKSTVERNGRYEWVNDSDL